MLGFLLFSIGSSDSSTALHGGDRGGKAYFPLLKSVNRQKAPLRRSVSTNFVATGRNSIKVETCLKLIFNKVVNIARHTCSPFEYIKQLQLS